MIRTNSSAVVEWHGPKLGAGVALVLAHAKAQRERVPHTTGKFLTTACNAVCAAGRKSSSICKAVDSDPDAPERESRTRTRRQAKKQQRNAKGG
jgi:hypothetical protein